MGDVVMLNNHDRPVTLTLTAERALKIAASLRRLAAEYDEMDGQKAMSVAAATKRARYCRALAFEFDQAASQADLPGTQGTALGKL